MSPRPKKTTPHGDPRCMAGCRLCRILALPEMGYHAKFSCSSQTIWTYIGLQNPYDPLPVGGVSLNSITSSFSCNSVDQEDFVRNPSTIAGVIFSLSLSLSHTHTTERERERESRRQWATHDPLTFVVIYVCVSLFTDSESYDIEMDLCAFVRCYTERSDTHAQGGSAAAAGAVTSEAGPLLSIQCRCADTAYGHVHCARSLARLYLVLHWTRRTAS